MKLVDVLLFAAYTIFSTISIMLVKQFAQPALETWKASPGVSTSGMYFAIGAVLYVVSFGFWILILSRVQLSIAYPVAVGLTLVGTTLASVLILHETVPL